jgi:hypothetical protein
MSAQSEIARSALLARPAELIARLIPSRTAMDAQQTFEGTLLHELTHAIKQNINVPEGDADRVVATDDVKSRLGGAYGAYDRIRLDTKLTFIRLEKLRLAVAIWQLSDDRHESDHRLLHA